MLQMDIDDDVSRLTEFRSITPDFADSKRSLVSEWMGKLFKKKTEKDSDTDNGSLQFDVLQSDVASQSSITNPETDNNSAVVEKSEGEKPESNIDKAAYTVARETHSIRPPVTRKYSQSIANITQRISSMLNVTQTDNGGTLIDYNQSHLRRYWMPDSRGKECYNCQEKFTTFRRRHHCRICGQIFCSRCCNQEIPGKSLGYMGDLRLCSYCCKEVLRFLNSSDGRRLLLKKAGGASDLNSLKEILLRSISESGISPPHTPMSATSEGNCGFDKDENTIFNRKTTSKDINDTLEASSALGIRTVTSAKGELTNCSAGIVFNALNDVGNALTEAKSSLPSSDSFLGGNYSPSFFNIKSVSTTNVVNHSPSSRQKNAQPPLIEIIPEIIADDIQPDSISVNIMSGSKVSDVVVADESNDSDEEWEPDWVRSIENPPVSFVEKGLVSSTPLGHRGPVSSWTKLFSGGSDASAGANLEADHRERALSLQESTAPVSINNNSPTIASNIETLVAKSPSIAEETALKVKITSQLSGGLSGSLGHLLLPSAAISPSARISSAVEATENFGFGNGHQIVDDNDILTVTFENQAQNLLRYMLYREHLGSDWFDILWPLARQISHTVQPDIRKGQDMMDITEYIHVKTLANSLGPQANVVFGTICSKTIADNRMQQFYKNPSILMIEGPIEYERVTGKFCSLDPVIMQEAEYLKNIVSKIASCKPDIVVVQHSVARIAQEFFRRARITLMYNIKFSVAKRIARATQAANVVSVDGQIIRPKLGHCGSFRTETVKLLNGQQKSLAYFEGCEPNLCCSVVLSLILKVHLELDVHFFYSAKSREELLIAKRILKFMIQSLYSSKLEMSLLKNRNISFHNALLHGSASSHYYSASESPLISSGSDSAALFGGCLICMNIFNYSPAVNSRHFKDEEGHQYIFNTRNTGATAIIKETKDKLSLSDALTRVPLDASPAIGTTVPIFETISHEEYCRLKAFSRTEKFCFDREAIPMDVRTCLLYGPRKKHFSGKRKLTEVEEAGDINSPVFGDLVNKTNVEVFEHPFIIAKLVKPANDVSMRKQTAQYRAFSAQLFRKKLERHSVKKTGPKLLNKKEAVEEAIDVMNPFQHRRFDVLFCSFSDRSSNAPGFCIPPRVFGLSYYGKNDIPLGRFIDAFCFKYKCPNVICDAAMVHHIKRFVHGFTCVEISMESIEVSAETGEGSLGIDEILTWDWCFHCKASTVPVVLSDEMWNLSLARYLDYLTCSQYLQSSTLSGECTDCLFHSHWQYFALEKAVVCVKVIPIILYDISLPSTVCEIEESFVSVVNFVDQAKLLSEISGQAFSSMLEQICAAKAMPEFAVNVSGKFTSYVGELSQLAEEHQLNFRSVVGQLQEALTRFDASANFGEFSEDYRLCKSLVMQCKNILFSAVVKWNTTVGEFAASVKKQKQYDEKAKDKKQTQKSSNPEETPQHTQRSQQQPNSADSDESADHQETSELFLTPPSAADQKTFCQSTESAASVNNDDAPDSQPLTPIHSAHSSMAALHAAISETSIGQSLMAPTTSLTVKRASGDLSASVGRSSMNEKIGLSNLLAVLTPIPLPFESYEHFGLRLNLHLPVIVSELEISSIIAYALSSPDCTEKLAELRNMFVDQGISLNLKHTVFNTEAPAEKSFFGDNTFLSTGNGLAASLANAEATSHSNQHIEVQFSDSSAKFYCKIYFAEHFRILRKIIFPQGESAFIRSLAHCAVWCPRGGKSGMNFFKTRDDRFLLKQMSRYEIQSFMKFAGNYFHYISTACTENKLTALAKIFGVYRIGYKNQQTGVALKIDVIVMENLFYRRSITQVFDLKGSMRNRLVSEKGQTPVEDLVLLDENLLKKICRDPLYVHYHSKTALYDATKNDSDFLAANLIMDYSLLVGIDEERRELVLGIIDYIRTYTWDKRLETFVKTVTVAGPLPTIVSPQLYCTRFMEAMGQYFLVAPDKWTKFAEKPIL